MNNILGKQAKLFSPRASWAHKTVQLGAKHSKCVWSGNTTITNRRQTPGSVRKSHTTITRHQEEKITKATSYKPLIQPSRKVRDPGFSGNLNPLQHDCQALDLLIIEVRDPQNIYSYKVICHILTVLRIS